jgi:poly(3-hydroxybutyrate) depolymerase
MLRRLLLLLTLFACTRALATDALPAYGADAASVTVSGLSSGGFMAVQFHIAHSSIVAGVGVLAGGPYYCAQGSVWTASYNCTTPGVWTPLPSVEALQAVADAAATAKLIDPTARLAVARIWLFAGKNDHTVDPQVVEALQHFYERYRPPHENIVFVRDQAAGHAMVTEDQGAACPETRSPFINNCHYDAAGELLKHLLGTLAPPAAKESGHIISYDQKPFAGGDAYGISMSDSGYVYVPRACESERCRIHVAFHGCRQSAEAIGEQFVREAGYNRWADSNRLIVLYPQTIARYGWGFQSGHASFVYNPRGCWDWWGYTGPAYHTKPGAQIKAVKAMIDRLAEPRR